MSNPKVTDQADRFREAAAATECDDDEARFNDNLRKIAKAVKPPATSDKKQAGEP
jgi:hypothetical protein